MALVTSCRSILLTMSNVFSGIHVSWSSHQAACHPERRIGFRLRKRMQSRRTPTLTTAHSVHRRTDMLRSPTPSTGSIVRSFASRLRRILIKLNGVRVFGKRKESIEILRRQQTGLFLRDAAQFTQLPSHLGDERRFIALA